MWALSIEIRGGRSPYQPERSLLVSDEFNTKIKSIRVAYADKLNARQLFSNLWFKISREIILPVLKVAESGLNHSHLHTHCEEKDGEIYLSLAQIPMRKGGMSRLSYYCNDREDRIIRATEISGNRTTEPIALESLSTELIESHVEHFLKQALDL
jgi:hypothetical protein